MTHSVRTYLGLMVLSIAVPLVGAVGYHIYGEAQHGASAAKAGLHTLASVMAHNAARKVQAAKETLQALSKRPHIVALDPTACDPVLKELHTLSAGFANVIYTNQQGIAVCSAVAQPGEKLADFALAPWFRDFQTRQQFSIGTPFVGPITGKMVSMLSMPVLRHGEMVGAVHLPLDLTAYDPGISRGAMPAQSVYGLYDADGVLIWQNNASAHQIGTPSADPAALHMVRMRNGELEAQAPDGVQRIYSFASIPELNWVAFVGVPTDFVVNRALAHTQWLALFSAIALVLLGGLAFKTARRIQEPIASLAETAASLGKGNLDRRAPPSNLSEIAAVAEGFNAMADGRFALSQRVEELSRRLVRTQEETRQRFSQELHDRTSPNLAALRINLDIIANTVNGACPDIRSAPGNDLTDRIGDTRSLIEDTNASIREICAGLHPAAIERGGILGVIQSHALQFAKRTGIQTQVHCPHHEYALQPDLELVLFRVFQEALTNCAKHAHATSVEVRLQLDGRPIFLAISDNGNGFDTHDTTQRRGLGLISMRETVELAGGQLRVESQPGRGTQVYVEI